MRLNAMYQIMDHKLIDLASAQPKVNRAAQKAQDPGRRSFDKAMRKTQQTAQGKAEQDTAVQSGRPAENPGATEDAGLSTERQAIAVALVMQGQPLFRELGLPMANQDRSALQIPTDSDEQLSQWNGVTEPTAAVLLDATDPGTLPQNGIAEASARTLMPEQNAEQASLASEAVPTGEGVQERSAQRLDAQITYVPASHDTEEDGLNAELAAAQETPLFGDVQAPPVKVAAPESAPIPLEQQDGTERLSAELAGLIPEQSGVERVELTLTPAHLGKLIVEITRTDSGALHIMLNATTNRAAALLGRNSENLQNLLTSHTRPDVQVQVRGGEEAQQQFLNPNDQNGREQQQRQQRQREERQERQEHTQDFMQQLRLGLISIPGMTEA